MCAQLPPKLIPQDLTVSLSSLKEQGKKIVFVSGVFDILHQEHLLFLEKARKQGDFLVVALESDTRVRQMKGEGRPVNSQLVRRQNLEKLSLADYIFILPENFSQPSQHRQLIQEIQPDFLAVSSHTAHLEKKRAIVEEFGGQLIVVHQHNPLISTSQLLAQSQKK